MAGIALVLGSVALGAHAVSAAHHTELRLAASQDLAAGAVLGRDDLITVAVQLPAAAARRYTASDRALIGRSLRYGLRRGELVPTAAVVLPPALTAVALTFPDGAAPLLARGERVRVWLSTAACPVVVLIDDTLLDSVRRTGGYSSESTQQVVIRLPMEAASRVMHGLALPEATLRAGIVTGASPPTGLAPISDCGPQAASAGTR